MDMLFLTDPEKVRVLAKTKVAALEAALEELSYSDRIPDVSISRAALVAREACKKGDFQGALSIACRAENLLAAQTGIVF